MKDLNKWFKYIETLMRRGQITISEGNSMMLQAIREECEKAYRGEIEEWDTNKAYHKMYLTLAKLTRD